MNVDKFRKDETGRYYDSDNCSYDDAEQFISSSILGFCGCGIPRAALNYVKKALRLLSKKKKLTHEQWVEEKKAIFLDYGSEYFTWYALENKGLTEHGYSTPGYLSEKGKELLSDLDELDLDEK